MTFMAVPMVVLYGISEVIARVHDRRKAEARRQRRSVARRGVAAVTRRRSTAWPGRPVRPARVARGRRGDLVGPRPGCAPGTPSPATSVADGHEPLACDLLAVDEAYPAPVAGDDVRRRAHQAWRTARSPGPPRRPAGPGRTRAPASPPTWCSTLPLARPWRRRPVGAARLATALRRPACGSVTNRSRARLRW